MLLISHRNDCLLLFLFVLFLCFVLLLYYYLTSFLSFSTLFPSFLFPFLSSHLFHLLPFSLSTSLFPLFPSRSLASPLHPLPFFLPLLNPPSHFSALSFHLSLSFFCCKFISFPHTHQIKTTKNDRKTQHFLKIAIKQTKYTHFTHFTAP